VSDDGEQSYKRPRLVFTDVQKRTLQAIFVETQRPSKEMQQTIAEHLQLDISTVSNYFMNARRRCRTSNANSGSNDEGGSYFQEVSTPPPETPTKSRRHNSSTSSTSGSGFDSQHINEAVEAVISNFANHEEQKVLTQVVSLHPV
jgi:hypothetical protein